ncbi:ParA family protein [Maribrevibacterium harenarium]|nr:AAA family ATPase [Maribrevibacterium harenarium]
MDEVAALEDKYLQFLSVNAGFIRHQLALRLLGYTGVAPMRDRFKDEIDGKKCRLLRDGSYVTWDDRPSDVLEEDGKKYIGWPLNNFIEEVIPHLKSRQSDRIQTDAEKKIFTPRPVAASIFNSKGGGQKTTTATHIAIVAALLGFRVLLIDGDPQATASTLMGYPFSQYPMSSKYSLHTALTDLYNSKVSHSEFNCLNYIRPSLFSNVSIITGSTHGSLIDILITKDENIVFEFINQLKDSGEFDLILTDTRPQSAYQDFAQYQAADFLINTLPASSTGIGSTCQGIFNYLAHNQNTASCIEARKNQLAIISTTCVENDPRHPSRTIYERIFSLTNDLASPSLNVQNYVPMTNIIADAHSAMETVFQQTNVDVPTSKTKRVIEALIEQFEQIFAKCIVPFWLNIDGEEVPREDVLSITGEIGDPLEFDSQPYEYLDLGFAFGITRHGEPATIEVSTRGKGVFSNNPNRFLKASDLSGDYKGNQIVMKNGRFYALSYNLDEIPNITPYVLRSNAAN